MKTVNWERVYNILCIAILTCILLFFLVGCTTKKIQVQQKESMQSQEVMIERVKKLEERLVDTTKTKEFNVDVEHVEFFNPGEVNDYDIIIAKMKERNEPYSNIGIPKSVTKKVDKSKETQSGLTKENSSTSIDTDKKKLDLIKIDVKTTTETVSFWQKYKWNICAFIIIFVIVFMFLKFKFKK